MKIRFTLVVIATLLCRSLLGQVLTVNQITQEQNQWCWAGSSKCILDYYNNPIDQCAIADYTRTVATWHNFGSVNCCTNPSGECNYWNYNWGNPGSIQDILVHFSGIQNSGRASALSVSDVQSELGGGKPFVIRWGWTTGGGHFVVGHGYKDDMMYYMDPWYGEGLKIASYSWVVSGSSHNWTHTNVITSNLPFVALSTNAATVGATANTSSTFTISSNTNWSISSDQSWLTTNPASGSAGSTITFNASSNSSIAQRTANITVTGSGTQPQILHVTQNGNITGIDDVSVADNAIISPNPTNGRFKLTLRNLNDELLAIRVLGANGETVKEFSVKCIGDDYSWEIDISDCADGVYYVSMVGNSYRSTKTVIVSKR